jgi:hypothetical protein
MVGDNLNLDMENIQPDKLLFKGNFSGYTDLPPLCVDQSVLCLNLVQQIWLYMHLEGNCSILTFVQAGAFPQGDITNGTSHLPFRYCKGYRELDG